MLQIDRPLTPAEEPKKEEVRHLLESELAHVRSPEDAEVVVERLEQLSRGHTEAERADELAASGESAERRLRRTAATVEGPRRETAAVLTEAAAQAVAPTSEAPAVLEGAQEAVGTRPEPGVTEPEVSAGRSYLKRAILKRMGPLQALDAQLYLAVNGAPHPRWLDSMANWVSLVFTGGWIWIIGAVFAYRRGVPRGRRALRDLVPAALGATWLIEYPIKSYFRRRRPFIDIVRALVVGKKPGSWSFPSGHTASSFASAWLLSRIWPRQSPLFFALASTVGLSRIYVGAHYPGDVASGATLGMALCEVIRRLARRLVMG